MSENRPLPALHDLTPEQQRVARTHGVGMAVLAGAGAGKTTTLVVKCAELLRQNPQAKIAAVSFTEKSAHDIREKLTRQLLALKPENPLSGHWVTTIHGLCRLIISEFPEEAGLPGTLDMLDEGQSAWEWSESVRALWLDSQDGSFAPGLIEEDLSFLSRFKSHEDLVQLLTDYRKIVRFYPEWERKSAESGPDWGASVARLTGAAQERYEARKESLGALDFEDLELRALQALRQPLVRQALQERFDLFLVDEFQDTNPIQAEIVAGMARPDFSNLCVIGDPKQSIYRFRDADVDVFRRFCARLPERQVLAKNFRSHPDLLRAINGVCAEVFSAAGAQDENAMGYDALVAGKSSGENEDAPVPRAMIWQLRDHADFPRWIRALQQSGESLETIVVLMRQIRGKGAHWLKALSQAGIPVSVGGSGRFWEDPRSLELFSFLKAWYSVGDKLPWIEALRAPWIRVEDARIDEWMVDGRDLKSAFLASGHPLAEWLALSSSSALRPGEILLQVLDWPGLNDEMQVPCLSLWHQLEELSLRGLQDLEILGELERALTEKHGAGDIPPPKHAGQLRVMTVHASKGLEFPHVILVDFDHKPKRAKTRDFYASSGEVYFLPIGEDGKKDKTGSLAQTWIDHETRAEVAESKRLLYVAMTRAMERLSLVFLDPPPEKDSGKEKKKTLKSDPLPYGIDHWRQWVETAEKAAGDRHGFLRLSDPGLWVSTPPDREIAARSSGIRNYYGPKASAKHDPYRLRSRYGVSELMVLQQCERRYGEEFVSPLMTHEAGATSFMEAQSGDQLGLFASSLKGPTAADLGTQVHRFLEVAMLPSDVQEPSSMQTEFAVLKNLANAGRFALDLEAIWDWAQKDQHRLRADPRETFAEYPFEFSASGEGADIVVGKIDRLELSSHSARIVDFKVTTRPKSEVELLAAYRTQLDLYALAVQRLVAGAGADFSLESDIVQISAQGVKCVRVYSDLRMDDGKFSQIQKSLRDAIDRSRRILNLPEEQIAQLAETPGPGCPFCSRARICRAYLVAQGKPMGDETNHD